MSIAHLLAGYGQSRREKINEERRQEDIDRDIQVKSYEHIVAHAEELGLTQDELRSIFNQTGKLFGHKPDPKLFGIFQTGDKGSAGKPDLGDMLFPQTKRDQPVRTGTAAGQPMTQEESIANPHARSMEEQIGPPPEQILTRRGEVPVKQLHEMQAVEQKRKLDAIVTAGNIEQGNAIASKQIYQAIDPKTGNVRFLRVDPATGQMKDISPDEALRSTQQLGIDARINKKLIEKVGQLKTQPEYANVPDDVIAAAAGKLLLDDDAADTERKKAKIQEIKASTNLKRVRAEDIVNPKITPYQAARLDIAKQALELGAARAAITEGQFDRGLSKDLVGDLGAFYKARNEALKTIGDGNEAYALKTPEGLAKAASDWRLGYMMLGQAKIMAEALKSNYPGMVNVANTNPNDQNDWPYVEVNAELPTKRGTQGQGKRSFTPSKEVGPEMIQQYREWLKGKGLSDAEIEEKVKLYGKSSSMRPERNPYGQRPVRPDVGGL